MWSLLLSSPTPENLITHFRLPSLCSSWLLLQVLPKPIYNCLFSHSPPGPFPLSYHLLQTLEDTDHNFPMFVPQHRVWRSCMYLSDDLLAITECFVCLRDSMRQWGQRWEIAFPDLPGSGVWWGWRATDGGRPCQPEPGFKKVREHTKGLKQRLHVTRLTALKEHSGTCHIHERVYFQRRRVENSWRRVHSKIQLCLFYPPNFQIG